jgi:glutamate-1-semialdehyde aminotransferase
VELEEVVAGGDELPFGAAGGQAATLDLVIPRRNLVRAKTVSMMCWRWR